MKNSSNLWRPQRGSIYLLATGLLSLLILLIFVLSSHSSGRARLLTLADQKQTALYALESCYGDIVSQLRIRIKNRDAQLLKSFIDATTGQQPAIEYSPGQTLSDMLAGLQVTYKRHEIIFESITPLAYPPIMEFPADRQPEKKGFLRINCEVSYVDHDYQLSVKVPYRTVFTLTPVLRQFIFFADHLDLEQPEKIGGGDRLNLISTANGAIDDTLTDAGVRLPLCLGMTIKPPEKINQNNHEEGYVFLGRSDKNIVLNLAGEVQPGEGDLADLWQVTPACFKPINVADLQIINASINSSKGTMQNKTLTVPLKGRNTRANLRLVGFCKELADPRGPWADDLNYTLEQDTAYRRFAAAKETLALSSGLKLFGPSFEAGAISARVPYPRNIRNIFGRVFNRFFVLGLFDFPSAYLNTKLLYNEAAGFQPPDGKSSFGENYPFELDSGSYKNYMSRCMSGDPGPASDFDHRNIPANLDEAGNPKLFSHADFRGTDGIKLKEPLDRFAGQWLHNLHSEALRNDPALIDSSIIGRITRVYRNQTDFKAAAQLDQGQLLIDGVVAIDGDLTLDDLPSTTEIRGGIVLVNGKISIGNLARGFVPQIEPPTQLMLTAAYRDYLKELKPESILTFISLTGDQITLTDNVQMGVHLISLKKLTAVEPMLVYANPGKVMFAGAIAVSTPDIEHLTRQFKTELPLFSFPPGMATAEPPMAVVISDELAGYEYEVR
ncbi:MAG TPA: hypothetical protein PKM56_14905 [Candidatus Rifleibacterium sp.]|nr:hypothetical protein [Candidatus Rifleibacterium sp.]